MLQTSLYSRAIISFRVSMTIFSVSQKAVELNVKANYENQFAPSDLNNA
jgi:hypothetical protein